MVLTETVNAEVGESFRIKSEKDFKRQLMKTSLFALKQVTIYYLDSELLSVLHVGANPVHGGSVFSLQNVLHQVASTQIPASRGVPSRTLH